MYQANPTAIPRTLGEVASFLSLPLPAGAKESLELLALKSIDTAIAGELSVLSSPAYADAARKTGASVVITTVEGAQILPKGCIALITPEPYVAFARALGFFYPQPPVNPGIASTAIVSGSATVHSSARIEPGAVLYAGVTVAEGAHIGAYTILGPGVSIGAHTRIAPHCSIFRASIGTHGIIHAGVAIGQDGFGFALEGTTLHKVPQLGGVQIGNDVEIGANTTIDAGALGDTIIEDHVKIDNQVQIAHNVRIGKNTRIVAQSGIAGSTVLGEFNLIGGQSGVAGHLTTAPGTALAGRAGLTKSVEEQGAVLGGMPAKPLAQWHKEVATLSRMAKNKGEDKPVPTEPQPKLVKVKPESKKTEEKEAPRRPIASGPDTDSSPF